MLLTCPPDYLPTCLEVVVDAELHEPGVQDLRRPRIRRVRLVHRDARIRVERVEDVDAQHGPVPGKAQYLAEAQIELVAAIEIHRVRLEQLQVDARRVAGQRTPERGVAGQEGVVRRERHL